LGLRDEKATGGNDQVIDYLMETILSVRQNAKQNKDYATADKIRDDLTKLGIVIKDTKEGAKWSLK